MSDLTAREQRESKLALDEREQKIETLLLWYADVLESWNDGLGADDMGFPMLSKIWNHPSYRELNRCLAALHDERNRIFWHIRERFMCPHRTVLSCPRCGAIEEVAARHFNHRRRENNTNDEKAEIRLKHKHAGEFVFFIRKSVPVVNAAVRPEAVVIGIKWLSKRFNGEVFIPDELRAASEKRAA